MNKSEETVEMTLDDFQEFKNKHPVKHRKSYYGRIEEYTLDGLFLRSYDSAEEIAEKYNVNSVAIYSCLRGVVLYVNKIDRIFLREGSSIKERLRRIEKIETINSKAERVMIDEYDIQGNYIKTWPSLSSINYNNYSIKNICLGERLYSRTERIFLFHGASIQVRLEQIRQKRYRDSMKKSIDEYNKEGILLKHWKSASEAAEAHNLSHIKILNSCLGVSNSVKGKIFLFSEGNIKQRLQRIKLKKKISYV